MQAQNTVARPRFPEPSLNAFVLHLKEYCHGNTRICNGCSCSLSINSPTTIYDTNLCIVSKFRRVYVDPKTNEIKTQPQPNNAYYHYSYNCVVKDFPGFNFGAVTIAEDIYPLLDNVHKAILQQTGVL